MQGVTLRTEPRAEDIESVKEIVTSTGFFYDYEIPVAVELVQERAEEGPACGYFFVFADFEGKTVSYACFGPIPCTKSSYDLYWIATHNRFRGRGLGKLILKEVEREVARLGGCGIYIETSSRPLYAPTRQFYLRCGYSLEASLRHFYDADDDKLIFTKRIG